MGPRSLLSLSLFSICDSNSIVQMIFTVPFSIYQFVVGNWQIELYNGTAFWGIIYWSIVLLINLFTECLKNKQRFVNHVTMQKVDEHFQSHRSAGITLLFMAVVLPPKKEKICIQPKTLLLIDLLPGSNTAETEVRRGHIERNNSYIWCLARDFDF